MILLSRAFLTLQHHFPGPVRSLPRHIVGPPRVTKTWVRFHPRRERAVRITFGLAPVLLIRPALQLRHVMAPVRLGPVPSHTSAPFHHAVILRPPRQIPDHADAQADQPQRQRRRQVATRSPGIAVVHSHRCWSSPAFEATAEFGLHHSRRHLDEVTLGENAALQGRSRTLIYYPQP